MDPIPTLETKRLRLRAWRPDDIDAFAAMMAEPETATFITLDGKPQDRAGAWRIMAMLVGHWHLRGFGMFVVEEKASGAFVGRVGPWMPEGWPGFEIGWGIRAAFRGKGYATEAAYAAGVWAMERFNQDRVISLINVANQPSERVAARLGERPLEETVLFGKPHRIWGATRAEWQPG